MPTNFLSDQSSQVTLTKVEKPLQLYAAPKADREPIRIVVIGSKAGVNTIVHALYKRKFAEVFEWTDFLQASSESTAVKLKPDEVMKVLVKYLPLL